MNDDPDDSEDETAQNSATPGNSPDSRGSGSPEELVQTHLDMFIELAESDLPVAKDAEKAVALTDGGEEQ